MKLGLKCMDWGQAWLIAGFALSYLQSNWAAFVALIWGAGWLGIGLIIVLKKDRPESVLRGDG